MARYPLRTATRNNTAADTTPFTTRSGDWNMRSSCVSMVCEDAPANTAGTIQMDVIMASATSPAAAIAVPVPMDAPVSTTAM